MDQQARGGRRIGRTHSTQQVPNRFLPGGDSHDMCFVCYRFSFTVKITTLIVIIITITVWFVAGYVWWAFCGSSYAIADTNERQQSSLPCDGKTLDVINLELKMNRSIQASIRSGLCDRLCPAQIINVFTRRSFTSVRFLRALAFLPRCHLESLYDDMGLSNRNVCMSSC